MLMMAADLKKRQELLTETWLLTARAILRALNAETPSASSLDVARRWLDSNGVTLETLRGWHGSRLEGLTLPTFSDGDEDDGAVPSALKSVPSFVE